MNRVERISRAYDLVVGTMRLRPPQQAVLERLRDLILRLPGRLSECSDEERRAAFTLEGWVHPFHPTFTAELATGVGKTRLMGAIIALLWLSSEANAFLILAPRRAVLRRIDDALDPDFREYLFIDRDLTPPPKVVRADQIDTPYAVETDGEGPTIFLLSPQLVTSSERFHSGSEFASLSAAEYLRRRRDLVVLVDESHHVGKLSAREASAWAEAIRALEPCLQVGFTATPRDEPGVNVLYRYPLQVALEEELYTKAVELWVRDFPAALIDTDELDHTTVDHALQLLALKREAVEKSVDPRANGIKPILVIFAKDTEHANRISEWLVNMGRVASDQLLVTHSAKNKTEEEIERLLSIEQPDNSVRVVVNVQELTEGWDVKNVYVIAPLRSMATFTGALQAMGRGLRLPAGRRLGDPQLDTLDVVVFGREKLKTILEEATRWGGRGVKIREPSEGIAVSVPVDVPALRSVTLTVRDLLVNYREPSFNIQPEAFRRLAVAAVDGIRLTRKQLVVDSGRALVRLDRSRFVSVATMRAIRSAPRFLSDELHGKSVAGVIEKWLEYVIETNRDISLDDGVPFDPLEVGEEIARIVTKDLTSKSGTFSDSGNMMNVEFGPYSAHVDLTLPEGTTQIPDTMALDELPLFDRTRVDDFIRYQLYRGWRRSVHPVSSFEGAEEALTACLLDDCSAVEWWVRNEPKRLEVPTPAGPFHPDFVACIRLADGNSAILLLEVKGDKFWSEPGSEPRVKARAAMEWSANQRDLTSQPILFAVALTSEVRHNNTLQALLPRLEPTLDLKLAT